MRLCFRIRFAQLVRKSAQEMDSDSSESRADFAEDGECCGFLPQFVDSLRSISIGKIKTLRGATFSRRYREKTGADMRPFFVVALNSACVKAIVFLAINAGCFRLGVRGFRSAFPSPSFSCSAFSPLFLLAFSLRFLCFALAFVCVSCYPCFGLVVFFMVALVGFCGSRSLPSSFAPVVSRVVCSVGRAGRAVAVGCASGADAFACSSARAAGLPVSFFAASSFGVGRASFARRSSALVSAVCASGVGCGLVAFVSVGCPAGLLPSSRSSRCFAGFGSGSWASVAFAVGLGVPVVVFPCGSVSLPAFWSGSWVACSGSFAGGFRFVPASLF